MSENCQRYCLNRPTNGKCSLRGNMQTIAFRLKVVPLKRRTWHTCETSTWNNSHIFWCNQFCCSMFTVNNETQNCDLCFFGCSTKVRWKKMNSLSLSLYEFWVKWMWLEFINSMFRAKQTQLVSAAKHIKKSYFQVGSNA